MALCVSVKQQLEAAVTMYSRGQESQGGEEQSDLIKTLNFITTRHSFPLLLLVFNGFMIPSSDA